MSGPFGVEALIACYRRGVFPMAESREAGRLFLVDPDWRGVIPIDGFHVPSRLARTVRSELYRITINTDFPGVLAGCAAPGNGREETWINEAIRSLYLEMFARGLAHSIEARTADGALVGGLYGVALGGAFFGESMFSRSRDASKVALVHLVARLKAAGFSLLDAQFWTPHLSQFGAEEIPRRAFKRRLAEALELRANFAAAPAMNGAHALQEIAQTS